MKKIWTILFCSVIAFTLFSCGKDSEKTSGYEIAMISDFGAVMDRSFNEGTWKAVEEYAKENNKTCTYYQPAEDSDTARKSEIDLAVNNGAKVIVTPGNLFENVVYNAQSEYPDIKFILIDGNPHDTEYNYKTAINTVGITFKEQEAGYLAGYSAVKDGYTRLGFMGGKIISPVIKFGYGFIQGAEDAAEDMDVTVEMNYYYTGDFNASANTRTKAAMWYESGVQVIFSCGGDILTSITEAADDAKGKIIGADVDQSSISKRIITSAMKDLAVAVKDTLDDFYSDEFPGGKAIVMGASKDAVALPMKTSKFKQFTKEDYDAIYDKLKNGDIEILTDEDVKKATDIDTHAVTINLIK